MRADRRLRRGGFTLLEMTVVIGLIMFLLTLSVIGYRFLEASASRQRTRTVLHNAEAMLAELDRTGGMVRLEGPSGSGAAYTTGSQYSSPGDVTTGAGGRTTAITNQKTIVAILCLSPGNQQAFAQLPSKMMVPNSNATVNGVQISALADGWGNPILYVPTGGLSGVTVNGHSVTITSPDNRPFFASAGPDGNFTTGDDNMYSFEK